MKDLQIKNNRLQQQANQLSIFVCAGYQEIKASHHNIIKASRSSSSIHQEKEKTSTSIRDEDQPLLNIKPTSSFNELSLRLRC
jgi:hypothetical protein